MPGQIHIAVAGPEDARNGYITWFVKYEGRDLGEKRRILNVIKLFADSPKTATDLWLHVLNLELVEEIRAEGRPRDEEIALLLENQRAATIGRSSTNCGCGLSMCLPPWLHGAGAQRHRRR